MTDQRRYVFDTNVLISAAMLSDSTPGQALRTALRQGAILLSQATAQELQEVLARPAFNRYLSLTTRRQFQAALLRRAAILEVEQSFHACRDPRDDKFLDLAVAGRASFLVTGDADLLTLDPFQDVRIVTAAAFLKALAE